MALDNGTRETKGKEVTGVQSRDFTVIREGKSNFGKWADIVLDQMPDIEWRAWKTVKKVRTVDPYEERVLTFGQFFGRFGVHLDLIWKENEDG